MSAPEITRFLHLRDYLRRWVAARPELSETQVFRWMGERVGLSREQVRNLIYEDGHVIQPDAIPAFARMLGLNDFEREYLRALIRVQGAVGEQLDAARLHLWELHAAATGVPADAVAAALEDDTDPFEWEAAALAALPLLRAHTDRRKAAHLAEVLRDGPDPATVAQALEAADSGLVLGTPSPRLVELPAPCRADDWETLCWHGLLGLARRALLRPAAQGRHLSVIIGSADAAAERLVRRAAGRLHTALRRVLADSAHRPVTHLVAVLSEQLPLASTSGGIYGTRHARARSGPARLPRPEPWSKGEESVIAGKAYPPGRPCIYHHMRFGPYVKEMVSWRKSHRMRATAAWFGKKLGVSLSYANSLTNGSSRLPLDRVEDMKAVLGLEPHEGVYLDGLARYEASTDPEERARARLALIHYAAQRGVRTLEGESFRASAHWGADAILALADLPEFNINPGWITRVLGGRLPLKDSASLATALLNAGLLAPQQRGPPRPATPERRHADPEPDLVDFAFQDSALRLLNSELRLPDAGRTYQGLLLALPEAAVLRVQRAFAAFSGEVAAALRDSDGRLTAGQSRPDRVLLSAGQLFLLSPDLRTLPPRRQGP